MKMRLILKIFTNPKYVISVFAVYCLGETSSPFWLMSTISMHIETYNNEDQKIVAYLKSRNKNIQDCYSFYIKGKARLKASFNHWIF